MERLVRTKLLIGDVGIEKLNNAKVIIFGVGGVGGYVAESLVRSGISKVDLVDKDVVVESNINRQIIATYETIGMKKVDEMKKRLLSINPNAEINTYPIFYLPNNTDIDFEKYDYIVDAIDTVSAKIDIIEKAEKYKIPIISAMGAGNKLDFTKFEVTDIYKTHNCPLAKVMRNELRKRKIKKLKVVYSFAEAVKPLELPEDIDKRKKTPGSISYNPAICGLMLSAEVINDLIG